MEIKSFKGGLDLPHNKSFTEGKPITHISLPTEIVIPLSQHTGAPCEPVVKVGDKVKAGQKVGESDKFVSAPVHTSLSGRVKAIEKRPSITGQMVESIVIQVDKEQKDMELADTGVDLQKVTREEILAAVKEAGIVGMGGATFPVSVKLSPPPDKPVDTLLINGCECEPFLTCDHRMMLEKSEELLEGIKLLMKVLDVKKCFVCIEDNKEDAITALQEKNEDSRITLVRMPTRYPQGSEKHLIKVVLDRTVPSGGLPFDVGALVQNVSTTVAIYEAVKYGKPLIERVVTVTGTNIGEPKNILTKIGTPLQHLIEECGGILKEPAKVVVGGPMTGKAQRTLDVPVVKGTTGVVVLPVTAKAETTYSDCVRCGKCVEHCPMFLYPNELGIYAEVEMYAAAEKWDAMDCIECGICACVCPSNRPLVMFIQRAKGAIQAMRQVSA